MMRAPFSRTGSPVRVLSWQSDALPDHAEVEVEVLKVDTAARRMSLSLKHLQENPWEVFVHQHPTGPVHNQT